MDVALKQHHNRAAGLKLELELEVGLAEVEGAEGPDESMCGIVQGVSWELDPRLAVRSKLLQPCQIGRCDLV